MSPALAAQAAWESERAALQSSCDALRSSLGREREWRAAAEKKAISAREEAAALREALEASLGSPHSSGGGGVTVPLRQYSELLALARQYRQTLLDLKTLQASLEGDSQRSSNAVFAAFLTAIPALPYNPLADDVARAPAATAATWSSPVAEDVAQVTSEGTTFMATLSPPQPPAQPSTSPRQPAPVSPTPLRNEHMVDSPPPPFLSAARAPIGHVHGVLRAELERPTTLTASALKTRLGREGSPTREALELLNDWQTPSPPPKNPGRSIWRQTGEEQRAGSSSSDGAGLRLCRFPQVEPVLPGKLDLEVYHYEDDTGRAKRTQRWFIANRSSGSTYTAEYRFAQLHHTEVVDMVLLGDAGATQDGRYVITVRPGERKPFLEGYPGRHTVVVRCDGSQPSPPSPAPAAAGTPPQRTHEGSRLSAAGGGSVDPSRRSETMPPGSTTSTAAPWQLQQPPTGALVLAEAGASPSDDLCRAAVPRSLVRANLRTALEAAPQGRAIEETDRLTTELVAEVTALAATFPDAGTSPVAIAALCHARGFDYLDAEFPPVTASLGNGALGYQLYDARTSRSLLVRWRPATACTPRGRRLELLSSVGVDPCALCVGPLGNDGVVAALAALAEAAGAVTAILSSTTAADEVNGVYSAWLCSGGEWRLVRVDAYLPCVAADGAAASPSTETLYGCVNVMSCGIWSSVCEKAMAKMLGSYRALRSVGTARALGLLTGGPVEVWDWWHQRSDTAFDEMEAAINTSSRGSGIVCITTRRTLVTGGSSALVAGPDSPPGASELPLPFAAAGLLPSTTYRVLAASENASGEPMLLIRNWRRLSQGSRRYSPEPVDGPISGDTGLCEAATVVRDMGSCIWLNYKKEVLPVFESCHVCFDCRRYHDLRVPIVFRGERGALLGGGRDPTTPCVPSHLLRVTVRSAPSSTPDRPAEPARLWIGLHQPSGGGLDGPLPHGLKLTLIGHDEARTAGDRRRSETALRPPAYYTLAESYGGEFQHLPAVWMYVELEPPAASPADGEASGGAAAEVEPPLSFYILPQIETVPSGPAAHIGTTRPAVSHAMRGFGRSATAEVSETCFLAVLAEDKAQFEVELLVAPEEMKAAIYHDVLERLDLDQCEVVKAGGPRQRQQHGAARTSARPCCQINGRWQDGFAWS